MGHPSSTMSDESRLLVTVSLPLAEPQPAFLCAGSPAAGHSFAAIAAMLVACQSVAGCQANECFLEATNLPPTKPSI